MSSGKVTAVAPTYEDGDQSALSLDTSGNLRVTGGGGGGSIVVTGNDTPSDTFVNPTDFVGSWSLLGGWNTVTSQWKRLRVTRPGSDIPAIGTYGLITSPLAMVYSVPGGGYVPLTGTLPSDSVANPANPYLVPSDVTAFNLGWNGTTWQRVRADVLGSSRVIASAPSPTGSFGCADTNGARGAIQSGVLLADPGKVLALEFSGTTVVGTYLMFFDNDASPSLGDTPIPGMVFALPDGFFSKQLGREHFGEEGVPLTTGLSYGFSSTAATFTIASALSAGSINVSTVS